MTTQYTNIYRNHAEIESFAAECAKFVPLTEAPPAPFASWSHYIGNNTEADNLALIRRYMPLELEAEMNQAGWTEYTEDMAQTFADEFRRAIRDRGYLI